MDLVSDELPEMLVYQLVVVFIMNNTHVCNIACISPDQHEEVLSVHYHHKLVCHHRLSLLGSQ